MIGIKQEGVEITLPLTAEKGGFMRVKIFTTDGYFSERYKQADEYLNEWLDENPDVVPLDIRFQGNVSYTASVGISGHMEYESILLIYKKVRGKMNKPQIIEVSEEDYIEGVRPEHFRTLNRNHQFYSFVCTWAQSTTDDGYYYCYAEDYYTARKMAIEKYARDNYISTSFVDVE